MDIEDTTYPIFSNALSIIKLLYDALELVLQALASLSLLFCRSREDENPFLQNRPEVGSRVSRLDQGTVRLGFVRDLRLDFYWVLHDGQLLCRRERRFPLNWQNRMPLPEPPGYTAPDRSLRQLKVVGGCASKEPVQQAILESGE